MSLAHEHRREHLIRLMGQYRVNCSELAEIVDRKPQTVRCWRSGHVPMSDHTLALIELALAVRAGGMVMREAG